MAIAADALIDFFGTQDQIDDGTTGTVADDAYSEASSAWTNDDDAPFASFVLELQFDTTMPTAGVLDLYARVLNIQSTNDPGIPDANYKVEFLGSFKIDFGVANDVNFFTLLYGARLPNVQTSQIYEFYFHNNGTGQTVGVDWNLWVTPHTIGPHA